MFDSVEKNQGVILLTFTIALSGRSLIHSVAEILDKLLGSKITVVVARVIIRVKVNIGDCQERVFFSSKRAFDFAENSQGVILLTLIIVLSDHS